MSRLFTLMASIAIAAALLGAALAGGQELNPGPPAAPNPGTGPEPSELRNGCQHLFTRQDHSKYTKKVYRRKAVTKSARLRVVKLRQCQKSDKLQYAARQFEQAQKRQRKIRQTRLCGTPSCNRELGRVMVDRRGWDGVQFSCLDELWGNRESGWNQYADNPNSSAYGIPQALPGSKMASHGSDWATNPRTQIAWGLDYIDGRYGTPCGAVSHSNSVGWY